jgi:ferredoxin-NADP reductase
MNLRTFTIRLIASTPLTELTRHLEFEVPGTDRFGFVPGQWLSLRAQHNGNEITRAYSLASPPAGNDRFAFCLNRVQDGFMSNYLCDLEPGAEITASGPFGDFILRPPVRDTILIATGTGIAPFRSMLHALFAAKEDERWSDGRLRPSDTEAKKLRFRLVFGSRYESDIYYHAEFQRLAAQHANFTYLPTLSRGGEDWKGLRGYVQEHVRALAEGHTDRDAFICGLDKMVNANRELLKSLGWERKAIRYEKYD